MLQFVLTRLLRALVTLFIIVTFTFNLESSYDWQREQWNVPANLIVSQMLKVGGHPIQVFGGIRYYLERPDSGADWGLRFGVTFLFPKG